MSTRRYEFGQPEDRTLVMGLRTDQLATLAIGLLVAVATVRYDDSFVGFAAASSIVLSAAAVAFWQLGGRTLGQWIPVGVRWTGRLLRRQHHFRSTMPLLGHVDGTSAPRPPRTLDGVRIIDRHIDSAGHLGILHDRRTGTYAAVLAVRGRSFQLADAAEKERRLAAWGSVLAGLARASSPVHRLQWVERTVPDDGDAMGRYLVRTARVGRGHPSLTSYLELVDGAGPVTQQHETLLVIAISAARARRQIKQAGGGDEGATSVLVREVKSLRRQLASADVIIDGALTPGMLAKTLRTGFEPNARTALARRAAAAGETAGTQRADAWPRATETTWSAYRVADVWHATYWVTH